MTQGEFASDPEPELPERGVIDALLDGELVEKDALRRALDDGEARAYLVEALLLRQLAQDMGPRQFVAPGVVRGPVSRSIRWLAAGVVLIASATGGYVYGQRAQEPETSPASMEIVVADAPPAAPAPTRVIRLEPGVNWTAANGGH